MNAFVHNEKETLYDIKHTKKSYDLKFAYETEEV